MQEPRDPQESKQRSPLRERGQRKTNGEHSDYLLRETNNAIRRRTIVNYELKNNLCKKDESKICYRCIVHVNEESSPESERRRSDS